MSRKLKKWQVIEENTQVRVERERECAEHLIRCKIKENECLKNQIKALEELNKFKDAVIYVLAGRGPAGKHINANRVAEALKNSKSVMVKKTKNGYRLKV